LELDLIPDKLIYYRLVSVENKDVTTTSKILSIGSKQPRRNEAVVGVFLSRHPPKQRPTNNRGECGYHKNQRKILSRCWCFLS
jgi:hypothetical protein